MSVGNSTAFQQVSDIAYRIYSSEVVSKCVKWSTGKMHDVVNSDIVKRGLTASAPMLNTLNTLKDRAVSSQVANAVSSSPYTLPVALLLGLGALLLIRNRRTTSDISLLFTACQKGNNREIQRLLARNVDVTAVDDLILLKTALHYAAMSGHSGAVGLLLGRQANPNAKDQQGANPLHWACMRNIETVRALIDHADLGAKDNGQATYLHWACTNGAKPEIVQLLLERRIDVAAVDKRGETALHCACSSIIDPDQQIDIVGKLIAANPRIINVRNSSEKTALDLCLRNARLADFLRSKGAE